MTSAKGVNDNDEWFTPKPVIEKVKEVFNGCIDLDPCSSLKANQRIMAKNYYTKDNSCLEHDWYGRVFLNPPYSGSLLSKVLKQAFIQYSLCQIDEMIILTNSGTDTRWNQLLRKGLQAYTIGRIRFIYPDGRMAGTPSRGQVFTYYGNNREKFIEVFTRKDFCWTPNLIK